jgi:hypothetical protein
LYAIYEPIRHFVHLGRNLRFRASDAAGIRRAARLTLIQTGKAA